MSFFKVNTNEENVKDYTGNGNNFLNNSGMYEVILKAVIAEIQVPELELPDINEKIQISDKKIIITELFNKLTPLLEKGNTQSLEFTGQIKKNLMPDISEAQYLLDEIENFNFDNALKILNSIKYDFENKVKE